MVKQFRRFMDFDSTLFPLRPAWVEIDLARLRNNLRLIRRDLPRHVRLLAVVKDEAYGRGALLSVHLRPSVVDVP